MCHYKAPEPINCDYMQQFMFIIIFFLIKKRILVTEIVKGNPDFLPCVLFQVRLWLFVPEILPQRNHAPSKIACGKNSCYPWIKATLFWVKKCARVRTWPRLKHKRVCGSFNTEIHNILLFLFLSDISRLSWIKISAYRSYKVNVVYYRTSRRGDKLVKRKMGLHGVFKRWLLTNWNCFSCNFQGGGSSVSKISLCAAIMVTWLHFHRGKRRCATRIVFRSMRDVVMVVKKWM